MGFVAGMVSLRETYVRLREHFGPLTGAGALRPWWPIFGDDPPFEMLVGAVLVQQTRWETVEAAVLRLLAAGLLNPPALAGSDPATLAALIRPAAFHAQKAPGLIAIARHLCAHHGGSMIKLLAQPTDTLRRELLSLPRIGPETCDVIMLYGGGHPVFVVDEYTRRLFERVGVEPEALTPSFWRRARYEAARQQIEGDLGQVFAGDQPATGGSAFAVGASTGAPIASSAPGVPRGLDVRAEGVHRPATAHDHRSFGAASHQLASLYAEFHAQINEACVRYCLARPRCDGPPARRVYSAQEGRESYLGYHSGCPLRPICGYYQRGGVQER